MSKHLIVTGAAGFIGANLCKKLIQLGHTVLGIDNLSYGIESRLDSIRNSANFTFIEADASSINELVFGGADGLIHLASEKIPRYSSGWETLEKNQLVSDAVLNYCINLKCKLYFASTSDVYGKNPELPFTELSDCMLGSSLVKRWAYAGSKLHTELKITAAHREFGLPFQIMRFFGCYGPGMAAGWRSGPQQSFFEKAIKAEPPEIHGDGTQTRTYIFIDDLIEAVSRLIENEVVESGIWNICATPSEEISVMELARKIWSIVNPTKAFEHVKVPYAQFGSYEDVQRRVGSSAKAAVLLNWEAKTHLEKGLQLTYQSLLDQ
jgi:UDP-glucose 4-epimerase